MHSRPISLRPQDGGLPAKMAVWGSLEFDCNLLYVMQLTLFSALSQTERNGKFWKVSERKMGRRDAEDAEKEELREKKQEEEKA